MFPFTVIINSTPLERLSARYWSVAVGIFVQSATNAFVGEKVWGAVDGSVHPKVLSGAEVRILGRKLKFFHSKLLKP